MPRFVSSDNASYADYADPADAPKGWRNAGPTPAEQEAMRAEKLREQALAAGEEVKNATKRGRKPKVVEEVVEGVEETEVEQGEGDEEVSPLDGWE